MKTLLQITLLNFAIFAIVHVLHFRFLPPHIIFLAGLVDTVIAVLVTSILASFLFRNRVLITASGMFCISTCMLYVSLVPTMVDRSITVHTLLSLREAGAIGLSEDVLSERLRGKRIIEKRFEELERTGAIENHHGQLKLTYRGFLSAMIFFLDMEVLSLDREYKSFQNGAEVIERNEM